jgi:ATP-dependent DNA ligase
VSTLTYKHPQGKVAVVHPDGTMVVTKNGKKASTSATPDKLAAGYGGWELVESEDAPAPAMPETEGVRFILRRPMKFQQADEATLLRAVTDDAWWMQQKVDGVRAQLVIGPDSVWARASTGDPLKSTVAGPVARKVIDAITPDGGDTVVLDGEILNGTWWMFDLISGDVTHDPSPYSLRLAALEAFLSQVTSPVMRLMVTSRTTDEKRLLVEQVIEHGAEGVVMKRHDSTYCSDMRVDHCLKWKATHTVDCVVTARGTNGHDNVTLGLYESRQSVLPVTVGNASMIGKGEVKVGDVVEVKYLYAGANGRLVQPTILRKRTDKTPDFCLTDQLVFVNKEVLT